MILGKTIKDWCDVYSLMKFYGEDPKSMSDLLAWKPPHTPIACLHLGLDLLEARKQFSSEVVKGWIETLMKERSA